MTRAWPLTVLGAMSLVVAGGCGGGGDELSREELISQGDAICERYEERSAEVEEPEGPDDLERFVEETRALIADGVDELDDLEPPEELADEYESWIAQNEENLELLDDLREAAAENDEARVAGILEEAEQKGERADELAREMGFRDCGALD